MMSTWFQVIITVSKYALTLNPIALSLEELVPSTWFRSYGVSIAIRTALVVSTLAVAMTIPFFGKRIILSYGSKSLSFSPRQDGLYVKH